MGIFTLKRSDNKDKVESKDSENADTLEAQANQRLDEELLQQVKQLSLEDISSGPDAIAEFQESEFISSIYLKFRIPAEESFLSLPIKYADNRNQEKNALGFKVASEPLPLDFKNALLPTIVGPQNALALLENVNINLSADYPNLTLPTETQWRLMNGLRSHATSPMISEQGKNKLLDYYIQLLILEEKFPLDSNNQLNIDFVWYDISGEHKVTTEDINYEKASVLYNVAAIMSILGCRMAKLASQNSIALAANYFQKAAGICQTILGITSRFKMKNLYELSPAPLTYFIGLMMSQANECFFHKAVESKVSSIVLAKIAAQVHDRYASIDIPSYISKHKGLKPAIANIKCKAAIFLSLAHEHMPLKDTEGKQLREKLARINICQELLLETLTKSAPEKLSLLIGRYLETLNGTVLKIKDKMLVDLPDYDRDLLVSIPRPNAQLATSIQFESDFAVYTTQAFDCFPTIIGSIHSESISLLFEECSSVCKPSKAMLKSIIKGVSANGLKHNKFLSSLNLVDHSDIEKTSKTIIEQQKLLKAVHVLIQNIKDRDIDKNIIIDLRSRLIKSAKSVAEYQSDWNEKLQPRLIKANQIIFKTIVENKEYCSLQQSAQRQLQSIRDFEVSLDNIIAESVVSQKTVHEVIINRQNSLNKLKNAVKIIDSNLQVIMNKIFTNNEIRKNLELFKCYFEFNKEVDHQDSVLANIANVVRDIESATIDDTPSERYYRQ